MDPFDSWTPFQQMSLFAGVVILLCIAVTIGAVWIAHRQNCKYEAERLGKQGRRRVRSSRP